MYLGVKIAQNCVCKTVKFTDWTLHAQEEPANQPSTIGKIWKSSFWIILRFMISSLLEEVMEVLVPDVHSQILPKLPYNHCHVIML